CRALDPTLRHGELVVVGEALADDGASRALGAEEVAKPDPQLTARLAAAAEETAAPARIVTTDLFYEDDLGPHRPDAETWLERGAVAAEMEAATLFTLGRRLGVSTACLLAVTDTFEEAERRRIGDEELADAAARMGAVAAAALDV